MDISIYLRIFLSLKLLGFAVRSSLSDPALFRRHAVKLICKGYIIRRPRFMMQRDYQIFLILKISILRFKFKIKLSIIYSFIHSLIYLSFYSSFYFQNITALHGVLVQQTEDCVKPVRRDSTTIQSLGNAASLNTLDAGEITIILLPRKTV